MVWLRLLMGALSIAYIVVLGAGVAQAQDTQTITYAPDEADFPNPERGFYHQDTPLWLDDERSPQTVDALRAMRGQGISMVRWYFLLDEYREQDLDAEVLAYIEAQFDNARAAGLKVIPRFAYNFPSSGEYPFTEPDATLERTLAHLDQLAPIIERSSDVIAFVEAGLVGAWGEWHSSTHGHVEEERGITPAARTIIDRWLQILPPERGIALRYPRHKQQLFGAVPLDASLAFSGHPQARVGAHNDCFLASATDWGTYPDDPALNQASRDYLHADNRYVPQGGETCNVGEDAQVFIGCENALNDLAYLRYSTLNIDYNTDVLDVWREQGCFENIARRLGYRLRLIEAMLPITARVGQNLSIRLTLVNEGFASPYNPRAVRLVLRSVDDGRLWSLPLRSPVDARRWLPDAGKIILPLAVDLPAELPVGEYEVLLHLPDPVAGLAARPEYAIRFANEDTWEAATGYNYLQARVRIQ